MFCRNCGHQLGDDMKFCPRCGKNAAEKNLSERQTALSGGKLDNQGIGSGTEIIRKHCKDPVFLIGTLLYGIGLVILVVLQINTVIKLFSALGELLDGMENVSFSDLPLTDEGKLLFLVVLGGMVIIFFCGLALTIAQIVLGVALFQTYMDSGSHSGTLFRESLYKLGRNMRTVGTCNMVYIFSIIGYLVSIVVIVASVVSEEALNELSVGQTVEGCIYLILLAGWACFFQGAMSLCGSRMNVYRRVDEEGLPFFVEDARPAIYCWIVAIVLFVAEIYLKINWEDNEFFSLVVEELELNTILTATWISNIFMAFSVVLLGIKFVMLDRELTEAVQQKKSCF